MMHQAGFFSDKLPSIDNILRKNGVAILSHSLYENFVRIRQHWFDGIKRIVEIERYKTKLRRSGSFDPRSVFNDRSDGGRGEMKGRFYNTLPWS